ncbi:symmetrical bis(5'-nucleosyl)-tetraphosphatase [Marinobacter salarius]|jgi:bis(5'-nucleosyl)-tetraphosphatase (symmetrical)|uniref:symmetrical bis(5'-nucleosyl)-tetraphosphatase n=1 Tax=Marinobacter salarius TaxID=1420917 RepID=UPI0010AA2C25|nr:MULTISPECIES: symmetrical bis(5'-nucleosyl)-tetraphosphatase [Marinobacter]MBJ7299333.1 symmetrical bis(5'-nucleosyl)-tetraphosphatase [Marinobacter salarius]HIO28381.1 symmetrical bis(5'-nucleosyl)-tetraphosphatase [Marinobacter salarius]HIO98360.1 symmetrical bis(5'-nucleosyl)-tetraphosphatase [Marinobacter salarius]
MTDYAIGDIQGCYERLLDVLAKVDFSPSRDRLWVAGDLINRGPSSLETLRYVESLGSSAVVVLGNHDLHLLAVAMGGHTLRNKDTLADILEAPDHQRLFDWLRQQNLCVHDEDRNLVMVHAGLPHIWSVEEAVGYSREVEAVIRGPEAESYFADMYGNWPERWHPDLSGMDRWRVITNYFTRMRFIAEDGTLELAAKESAASAPDGYAPWFRFPRQDDVRVVFGHWAALEGQTESTRYFGLDTGCVWGGKLTLMNLDTGEKIHCDC